MANILFKGGSVKTLTDARYFSSRMAAMVGFCLDTSSVNFIPPQEVQQIMNWLEGPQIVGEFSGKNLREIKETAMILNLDLVQFPIQENTAGFQEIEKPIIVALIVSPNDTLAEIQSSIKPWEPIAAYFQYNLRTHFENWETVKNSNLGIEGISTLLLQTPGIIDVPFQAAQLNEIIALNPALINLVTPPAQAIGEKNFDDLQEIIDTLTEH